MALTNLFFEAAVLITDLSNSLRCAVGVLHELITLLATDVLLNTQLIQQTLHQHQERLHRETHLLMADIHAICTETDTFKWQTRHLGDDSGHAHRP